MGEGDDEVISGEGRKKEKKRKEEEKKKKKMSTIRLWHGLRSNPSVMVGRKTAGQPPKKKRARGAESSGEGGIPRMLQGPAQRWDYRIRIATELSCIVLLSSTVELSLLMCYMNLFRVQMCPVRTWPMTASCIPRR